MAPQQQQARQEGQAAPHLSPRAPEEHQTWGGQMLGLEVVGVTIPVPFANSVWGELVESCCIKTPWAG